MSSRDAWTEPGVEEVSPGVHRIPLPLPNDGLRAVNVYVVEAPEGPVLVDAGWAIQEARDLLARGLDRLGHGLGDVRRFLVTHMHRDHYTMAVALRREFGTTVSIGAGERAGITSALTPGKEPMGRHLSQLRRLGGGAVADGILAGFATMERQSGNSYELPDDWLADDQRVEVGSRTLAVVATPGHTQGHVVFHDPGAGLLFAGDHVLPTITPSIGFEPVDSDNPLGDFLHSLAVVRALPDAVLLPAHGPVTPSVHARVDELVAHHGTRLDQTLAAVLAGAETGYEVAGRLRWTRRGTALPDLDPFNTMLAISETGAHLDLLVAQGRLTVTVEDGVLRYREA